MADLLNTYSIRSLQKVLQEDHAGQQEQLTIEFLRNLIRQSLTDFVNAEYPFLDFDKINQMVNTAVLIKTSYLEVDTVRMAEEVVQTALENREQQRRALSKRLLQLAKNSIARFLHYSELKKQGTKITAKDFVSNGAGRLSITEQEMVNILARYRTAEELRVSLQGKVWKVKLVGYEEEQDITGSKRGKLLIKVKQKLGVVKNKMAEKLKKMAKFLKAAGSSSAITIEVKPFLKGAIDKMKFVEDLARSTFTRVTDADISELAGQNLLQTLDLEIDSLERYINKVEKIFNKLRKEMENNIELPVSPSLLLTEEDRVLLKEIPIRPITEEEPLLLEGLEISEESKDEHISRSFDNNMDWSVKARQILKDDIVEQGLSNMDGQKDQRTKKGSIFSSLLSKVLDPRKFFPDSPAAQKSAQGNTKNIPQKVDLFLQADPEFDKQELQRLKRNMGPNRKFFHHTGL